MLGVWGSRTRNSSVFTGRNLDWNANTGINKFKLVTVYNFNHSAHSHATIGYAGLAGALTGLSTKGVSVHEANLEEEEITFRGFPWLLRLRYIMENAATVAEAVALWNATNNTAGFNHGIGAPADGFVVLETRAHYSAVFKDDDPREMGNASSSFFVGHPMKDALWRTNHGYGAAGQGFPLCSFPL
jgi:predicted choloylglycine hydrolase